MEMMAKIENEKKSIEEKILRANLGKEINDFMGHLENDISSTFNSPRV